MNEDWLSIFREARVSINPLDPGHTGDITETLLRSTETSLRGPYIDSEQPPPNGDQSPPGFVNHDFQPLPPCQTGQMPPPPLPVAGPMPPPPIKVPERSSSRSTRAASSSAGGSARSSRPTSCRRDFAALGPDAGPMLPATRKRKASLSRSESDKLDGQSSSAQSSQPTSPLDMTRKFKFHTFTPDTDRWYGKDAGAGAESSAAPAKRLRKQSSDPGPSQEVLDTSTMISAISDHTHVQDTIHSISVEFDQPIKLVDPHPGVKRSIS